MRRSILLSAIIGLALSVPSSVRAQRKQSFDEGWRFHRGSAINAEAVNCADSGWRTVIVPHDFSMEPVAYTHDYLPSTSVCMALSPTVSPLVHGVSHVLSVRIKAKNVWENDEKCLSLQKQ